MDDSTQERQQCGVRLRGREPFASREEQSDRM